MKSGEVFSGAGDDARVPLEDILPSTPYKHRLRVQRGEPGSFFRDWDRSGSIRAERLRWLREAPERHSPALPEAEPLLDEAADLLGAIEHALPPVESSATSKSERWRAIESRFEPDLVVLARDAAGFRMVAGSVCFPSSWAPEEKLGRPLEEIHAIVPGLNRELGGAIRGFLERIQPGVAWLRANWGLSASAELNQHPGRRLPRLNARTDPAGIWMRIEHQALLALPKTGGILFGIRVEQCRLPSLQQRPLLVAGLTRALETMSPEMASYKGIAEARPAILGWLGSLPRPPVVS